MRKDITEEKQPTTNRWEKGKCYKCQEPWIPGHGKICKFRNQIHLIAIGDEDTTDSDLEEPHHTELVDGDDTSSELQVSMHALARTSSKAQTFPLFVNIGNNKFLALIDSGSTSTFLGPPIIAKVHITVTNHSPVKVIVANGNILWTQAICTGVPCTIQGHKFNSDFRVLELQGYTIILGCD
jgi:hypothetical protein